MALHMRQWQGSQLKRLEVTRLHPLVLIIFIIGVIALTMLSTHPLSIFISLMTAIITLGKFIGVKTVCKRVVYLLPFYLIVALCNPLFVHQGVTILFYVNDNPITKEAIIYGFVFSLMMYAIILWCQVMKEILDSDKILYLFSKTLPLVALMMSMTLRFIPKFHHQLHMIMDAQRLLGNDIHSGSILHRIRSSFSICSMLITWAFETSVDTANSMNARGYGLRGRTSYSTFTFTRKDKWILAFQIMLLIICLITYMEGAGYFYYYPMLMDMSLGLRDFIYFSSFCLFCGSAFLYESKEVQIWNS